MQITIRPGALSGTVVPPPSKSVFHRAVICASLARGKSSVSPYRPSADIDATIGAMRALGARIDIDGEVLHINGTETLTVSHAEIDCRESGSTLRFLIPVAAAGGGDFTFIGSGRLPQRPIGPFLDCLPKAGVSCVTEGGLPLKICGRLSPDNFKLPGNLSSQFITGLLLALPLLEKDSRIALSSPLESAAYIDLTLDVLRRFGVNARPTETGWTVPGGQSYLPGNVAVEGDWSQAAFWLAAGALGGPVGCTGLSERSLQGDRTILNLLEQFGAELKTGDGACTASGSPLRGIEIDASQIPDLVPILAVLACFAQGRTVIRNAARLRIKETDRLHTIALGLSAFGASVTEKEDGLVIDGGRPLPGGTGDGTGDHRIVMALAVAAAYCQGPCTIRGAESIEKSYPSFFRDFEKLGGKTDGIHMG